MLAALRGRVHYAWHCLPRDEERKMPPSKRQLETDNGLAPGTFTKLIRYGAEGQEPETIARVAIALGVGEPWLQSGKGKAPTLTGYLEPLPPLLKRAKPKNYRELDGWAEALKIAIARRNFPPAAFEMAGRWRVLKMPAGRVDATFVEAAANLAWLSSSVEARTKLSTLLGKRAAPRTAGM